MSNIVDIVSGKEHQECGNYSQRSFSSDGLGYSINMEPFWSKHQQSHYNELFLNSMMGNVSSESGLWHPRNKAAMLTLELKHDEVDKPQYIVLHDPMEVPDLLNGKIILKANREYTILITPSVMVADPSINSLSIDRRGCQLKEETGDLKIFKHYSQSACLLECQLQLGLDTCGCIPWNFPHFNTDSPVCHEQITKGCFYPLLLKTTVKACNCPQDCDAIQYEYAISSVPMEDISDEYQTMRHGTYYQLAFLQSYNEFLNGVELPYRQPKLKIYFKLSSSMISRNTKTARTSFVASLSNLGKPFATTYII